MIAALRDEAGMQSSGGVGQRTESGLQTHPLILLGSVTRFREHAGKRVSYSFPPLRQCASSEWERNAQDLVFLFLRVQRERSRDVRLSY